MAILHLRAFGASRLHLRKTFPSGMLAANDYQIIDPRAAA
jgi:hypothetical protein